MQQSTNVTDSFHLHSVWSLIIVWHIRCSCGFVVWKALSAPSLQDIWDSRGNSNQYRIIDDRPCDVIIIIGRYAIWLDLPTFWLCHEHLVKVTRRSFLAQNAKPQEHLACGTSLIICKQHLYQLFSGHMEYLWSIRIIHGQLLRTVYYPICKLLQ